jgi:NADH-quinone oxidoreductase subunit M
VMIAHGFLAALNFGLNGYIYQQTGTLQIDQLSGLLRRLPFVGAALMMAGFAGCGLPGFANFAGEVTVFFGAWNVFRSVTVLACWGALIIGAVYMLRALRSILHGPLPDKWAQVADAPHLWRKAPFAALLAALLLFGCFPRLLTDKIKPSVEPIVARFEGMAAAPDKPRTVPVVADAALRIPHS